MLTLAGRRGGERGPIVSTLQHVHFPCCSSCFLLPEFTPRSSRYASAATLWSPPIVVELTWPSEMSWPLHFFRWQASAKGNLQCIVLYLARKATYSDKCVCYTLWLFWLQWNKNTFILPSCLRAASQARVHVRGLDDAPSVHQCRPRSAFPVG